MRSARRGLALLLASVAVTVAAGQALPKPDADDFADDLPAVRTVSHLKRGDRVRAFATFAQCQVPIALAADRATSLPVATDAGAAQIALCVDAAAREQANVLILPELALAFREPVRRDTLDRLRRAARQHDMIIVAGSYYDGNRQSRLQVIGPDWEELGFKIHPSRFEASPRDGRGMRPGDSVLVIHTPYGRIMPLTCVDLISDGVQYVVRNLATRGQIDVVANINYNPAAWEFMIEANSLARRHPVFVSITNAAGAGDPQLEEECRKTGDTGRCFGNTSLFANLRERDADCPNCAASTADLIEPPFMAGRARALAYDSLVAAVPPFESALLVYDLNLRLVREPATTNAPDQGYPTVRNVRRVALPLPAAR